MKNNNKQFFVHNFAGTGPFKLRNFMLFLRNFIYHKSFQVFLFN